MPNDPVTGALDTVTDVAGGLTETLPLPVDPAALPVVGGLTGTATDLASTLPVAGPLLGDLTGGLL